MENRTTASEIIVEQESRMRTVLYELDATIMEDLERCRFVLGELLNMAGEPVNSEKEALAYASNQSRIEQYACIAVDYLANVQRTIEDIVRRERKQEDRENADD